MDPGADQRSPISFVACFRSSRSLTTGSVYGEGGREGGSHPYFSRTEIAPGALGLLVGSCRAAGSVSVGSADLPDRDLTDPQRVSPAVSQAVQLP
eukprot:CAMPEP_0174378620 /NCGR_PEP_ID=MMETSP0811_2-20130205/122165_1 /TAXON_ID=73025 ORGANISM="Eutreptiella gymnastica-like, Strain CCMP1594" /NCGR_SAMPLE_ID=MMETSP0811_2 /ASSEMBLY_ACC=CAM_ASM_000667 /LENGTH=94 /DNA_ID=CAMNT_0015530883 /DNA_START=659 /DNA_END=941 /DNA_ORIENTATION=+